MGYGIYSRAVALVWGLGEKMGLPGFDKLELIASARIRRERGWLYFLRGSDVMRAPMAGLAAPGTDRDGEVVWRGSFVREPGWFYFIDARGDIRRVRRG
jgi:hypothetical protein